MTDATTIETEDETETEDDHHDGYERGDYFEEYSDPHVEEFVVIETGHISGYEGVRIAERDVQTGKWRAYWLKMSYLHDEVNLGSAKHTKTVDEDDVQSVERGVRADHRGTGEATPQRVASD